MKNVFKNIVILLFLLIGTELTAQQDLKIIYPNGGEQLVVGTDVEIRWQGVPPQKFVILDYSTDNGQSWKRITDKATGLKYTWPVPNDASKQCLLRANLVNGVTPAEWARNAVSNKLSTAQSIQYDNAGNIYICGYFFADSLDFGNNVVIKNYSQPGINSEGYDIFIAKYDYYGNILWAKSFGWYDDDQALSICIDKDNNLYMAGVIGGSNYKSGGTIDFGNNIILDSVSLTAFFLAKFDSSGTALWAKKINNARWKEHNNTISVALDSLNHVLIGGYAPETQSQKLDFGNGIKLQAEYNIGFVAKYKSNNGELVWVNNIEAIGITQVTRRSEGRVWSIVTDTASNIYICGHLLGSVRFSKDSLLSSNEENGEAFLAKYTINGDLAWIRRALSPKGSSHFTDLTIDRFNNIYTTGSSLFLSQYSIEGERIWIKEMMSDLNSGIGSHTITTDSQGNIILAGAYAGRVDLGNSIILEGGGNSDVFLAKFNERGNTLWAKTAKDGGDAVFNSERFYEIAIDPYGSIAACGGGGFAPPVLDFGNGNVLKGGGAFIAKYDNEIPVGTQDFSDNTWTIDKPEFSALYINMGKVLLGAKKDSVITAFIRNEGGWPVDVRDIQLSGAQASEFQILTGKPPFIIPVNEVATVEFRFTPAATGIRQANLTVVTPIDNLYQIIQGEGVQPLISIAASLVNMGIVEIGSKKDTTLTAIVENIGSAPLKITSTTLTGSYKNAYTLVNSPGSFILQAGSKQTIELRFSPQAIGQMNAEIQFEYEGMTSGPAIARITGIGIGGSMYVENDSAYAGESRFLKINLNKHTAHSLQQQKPVGFKASLSYGNSIIAPALNTTGVTVANNNGTGTVEITSEWNGTSTTLATIPFTATLGDRTETPLELLSFQWLNDAGEIINSDTELQNGTFTMLGICEEGGTRLYDVNGKAQMMMIAPNPANGVIEVTFETVERDAIRLMLTDALGQQSVLKEGSFEKGRHSFAFDAGGLASGMYILTMQTPTQVFTQQVIIGK